MSKTSDDPADLRREAEARLKARQGSEQPGAASPEGSRKIRHELEVHQIELELQNDELAESRLKLEASLERYLSLFDFAPLGYAILDRAGIVREVNHAGARIIDYPRSKIVSQDFEAFVSLRDRPGFRMLLGRALDSGGKETCELELARSPSRRLQARLSASVLAHPEPMVLLAFEDITESKDREQRLAERENALRDVDRRKDEFLAVLSHELRNPLGAIRNSLSVLSRAPWDGEQAARTRSVIDRQASLLTRIVDDLLDVTRIARGKIELQRKRIELGDLVRRTLDDHRLSFEAAGLRLEGRFEAGQFWVDADAARLAQVVGNLLANAEKFTPRGGLVLVSLHRDDDRQVALRVRDTGAGIAPQVLPHLFETFVQAPQTVDRSRGGLGLGLAMVKGLVELHGGSVGLASEGEGRGTEVTIMLSTERPPTSPAVEAPDVAGAPGRRVLVIDDNADNADTMREALEQDAYDVRVAYDGPAGLALARSFHPEVVICDLGLPEMDGYAVARAFRAEESLKDVPLIAVSGYTRSDDVRRANEAGFDRHLAKPVDLETLERVIAEVSAPPDGGQQPPAPPAPESLH
jgi:two-component system CheB/CheR fusion protein